ncbi:MAG: hypothetical protein H6683_00200 [Deltaproteobacteria bacterium]|nr:hypothetical protein [Deltaproteobacteria bacterium]MCB9478077.1 hypothetical protein [Deltaproteobacteria bacterium]
MANEQRDFGEAPSRRAALLYLAAAVAGYVGLVVLIAIVAPIDDFLRFRFWVNPESSMPETVSLYFQGLNLLACLVLLVRAYRVGEERAWRTFLAIFFFIWFGEDSQWGQAIFYFPTPSWWMAATDNYSFDMHTSPLFGVKVTLTMMAATAVIWGLMARRARRGDRAALAFLVSFVGLIAQSLILHSRTLLWQFFFSYFTCAYFVYDCRRLRAWRWLRRR